MLIELFNYMYVFSLNEDLPVHWFTVFTTGNGCTIVTWTWLVNVKWLRLIIVTSYVSILNGQRKCTLLLICLYMQYKAKFNHDFLCILIRKDFFPQNNAYNVLKHNVLCCFMFLQKMYIKFKLFRVGFKQTWLNNNKPF